MTGRDGKQYPATRPQKPASKPEQTKKPTPEEWETFTRSLTEVSEFATTITASNTPESIETWQLAKQLEAAARTLFAVAAKLRNRPR